MKAWRIERHGGIDQLKRGDIDVPEPKEDEVRVRVKAVGLNHLDLWVVKGVPGHQFPLPMTVGCDVVGVVDSLGPLSQGARAHFQRHGIGVGSTVIVNPLLSCGKCMRCKNGQDATCVDFGLIGETRDGGCAEFMVAPVENLLPKPEAMSVEEAASLPIAFVTAWSMVNRKARVKKGEWVLVQAGGSGVSVAAIQMAKCLGATVVTTVGDRDKGRLARDLGADHVLFYKETPFRESLKALLKQHGRRGVDVAIDHVGVSTFADSLKSLDWGGRLVTCGATTGSQVEIDLKPVFFKSLSILGSTMGAKADLGEVVEGVVSKKWKPVIAEVKKMDELPKALQLLEEHRIFGKVVVVS